MRTDFDDLLKDKLGDYEYPPSDNMWNSIHDRISSKKGFPWKPFLNGLAILLVSTISFIGGSVYFADKMIEAGNNQKFTDMQPDQPPGSAINSFAENDGIVDESEVNRAKRVLQSETTRNSHTSKFSNTILESVHWIAGKINTEKFDKEIIGHEIPAIENEDQSWTFAFKPLAMLFPGKIEIDDRQNYYVKGIDNNTLEQLAADEFSGRPYLGFALFSGRSWILNQNTYGEFEGRELAYQRDYSKTYSLLGGYEFRNRKMSLHAELIVSAVQGQKYRDMFREGLVRREINLDYTYIPVIFKYKTYISNFYNSRPLCLNYLAGLQYGRLRSAEMIINHRLTNITERIQRNNFGFLFGCEIQKYISNDIFISTGLHTTVSSNINASGWSSDDNYGKSHNLTYGLKGSINYVIE